MGLSVTAIADGLIRFYSMLIFVYVLLSWFPASGSVGEFRRVLGTICEPYIGIFRRFLPGVGMGRVGLDFSPVVALLVLQIVVRPTLLYILGILG